MTLYGVSLSPSGQVKDKPYTLFQLYYFLLHYDKPVDRYMVKAKEDNVRFVAYLHREKIFAELFPGVQPTKFNPSWLLEAHVTGTYLFTIGMRIYTCRYIYIYTHTKKFPFVFSLNACCSQRAGHGRRGGAKRQEGADTDGRRARGLGGVLEEVCSS